MQAGSMNTLGSNYGNYGFQKKQDQPLEKIAAQDIGKAEEPPMLPPNEEAMQALDQQLSMNIGIANEAANTAKKEIDKKEDAEEIAQSEALEEPQEIDKTQEPEAEGEVDEEMIANMKKTITLTSGKVARKVNKSAFKYMEKNNWITSESRNEAEEFFTIKVPKVMARELSKILNEALGLDPIGVDEDSGKTGVA